MSAEINASSERLATFVQISDLHFGLAEPSDLDRRTHGIIQVTRIFDGLFGHSTRSLRYLRKFLWDICEAAGDPHDVHLIVTGDVTATGADAEVRLAKNYFENRKTSETIPPVLRSKWK